MLKLILNADDFGLNKSVTEGIIESFEKGLLTSTTIMMNTDYSDKAINYLKNNNLSSGIHLNLNFGKPISSHNNLTHKSIFFRNVYYLIHLIKNNKINLNEIEKEFNLQLEKAFDNNLKITHIDSHKHIHMYIPIFKIIEKLAKKFKIKKIRISKDYDFFNNFKNEIKNNDYYFQWYIQLKYFSGAYKSNYFETYNKFLWFFKAGNVNYNLLENFIKNNSNKNEVVEIMFHPGFNSEDLRSKSSLTIERENELHLLKSKKLNNLIKKYNVKIIDFNKKIK